ncbi:MAG: histidine kinase [Methylococcales bacterium]|nr:histidine kinase [Methylococcales bacterium]MDD5754690.1 histidine kinase [Methylococcales bacterium]
MKKNTLRYQINSHILFLVCCIFVIGGTVTLWQARRSVQDEMQSSIHLAVQLITFNLSQTNARTEWLAQLNSLKETRHLRIQLKEPSGQVLNVSQSTVPRIPSNPPKWFVNLVASSPIQIERTLITNDGQALIVLIEANPLNEISEAWQESVAFFGLLFLLIALIFLVIHVFFKRILKTITVIVKGLERVELGDYQNYLPSFSSDEMNRIGWAINRLIEKLNTSQQENRALTQHNLTIQENERQRLAQELHDELGQSLTAIKVMTVAIARAENTQNSLIKQSTEAVIEICDHLMAVVRSMMQQLHPLVLTELGLKAALDDLINHWHTRHPDLLIHFNCDEAVESLPETISIHIFRIVQECLTNIVRHAQANQASIDLTIEKNQLSLTISDNGQGCENQNIKNGFGLLSMRERIRSLNGDFFIETKPKNGMTIRVNIPL